MDLDRTLRACVTTLLLAICLPAAVAVAQPHPREPELEEPGMQPVAPPATAPPAKPPPSPASQPTTKPTTKPGPKPVSVQPTTQVDEDDLFDLYADDDAEDGKRGEGGEDDEDEDDEDDPSAPGSGLMLKVTLPALNHQLEGAGGSTSVLPAFFAGGMSRSGLGAGLGIGLLHTKTDYVTGGDVSSYEVVSMVFEPSLVYITSGFADGRIRAVLQGGPVFGFIDVTEGDTTALMGYKAAAGGSYFPHRSFGIGVEAGITGLFALGENVGLSINLIYGALVAMVILGG